MLTLQPRCLGILCLSVLALALTSCATTSSSSRSSNGIYMPENFRADYTDRLPKQINTNGQRVVVVDPSKYVWGAYGSDGELIRAGVATSGGDWCPDDNAPRRPKVGTFRISSLGSEDCKSRIYPRPEGGGLMPYCMFFSGGQALHGSPDITVVENNVSHGCVRMRIQDAEWMRNSFASVGTKVIVRPYEN